ncbi:uncharacterized protein LOC144599387 [Rhinoraja longicauda]
MFCSNIAPAVVLRGEADGDYSMDYVVNRSDCLWTMVERVKNLQFLGMHISEDLSWTQHTDAIINKAHQRLYFLRRLRRFGTSKRIRLSFYRCTVESILTGCITAWFSNLNAQERKRLQQVVNTAQSITGSDLPTIEGIYQSRCLKKAASIMRDPHHPGHTLISPLPSGRYRSLKTVTSRFRNSFFPTAIRLLNTTTSNTL